MNLSKNGISILSLFNFATSSWLNPASFSSDIPNANANWVGSNAVCNTVPPVNLPAPGIPPRGACISMNPLRLTWPKPNPATISCTTPIPLKKLAPGNANDLPLPVLTDCALAPTENFSV